jgi:Golgi nucleoside diphosphatase
MKGITIKEIEKGLEKAEEVFSNFLKLEKIEKRKIMSEKQKIYGFAGSYNPVSVFLETLFIELDMDYNSFEYWKSFIVKKMVGKYQIFKTEAFSKEILEYDSKVLEKKLLFKK